MYLGVGCLLASGRGIVQHKIQTCRQIRLKNTTSSNPDRENLSMVMEPTQTSLKRRLQ